MFLGTRASELSFALRYFSDDLEDSELVELEDALSLLSPFFLPGSAVDEPDRLSVT